MRARPCAYLSDDTGGIGTGARVFLVTGNFDNDILDSGGGSEESGDGVESVHFR